MFIQSIIQTAMAYTGFQPPAMPMMGYTQQQYPNTAAKGYHNSQGYMGYKKQQPVQKSQAPGKSLKTNAAPADVQSKTPAPKNVPQGAHQQYSSSTHYIQQPVPRAKVVPTNDNTALGAGCSNSNKRQQNHQPQQQHQQHSGQQHQQQQQQHQQQQQQQQQQQHQQQQQQHQQDNSQQNPAQPQQPGDPSPQLLRAAIRRAVNKNRKAQGQLDRQNQPQP
jgi:hypothetical protein